MQNRLRIAAGLVVVSAAVAGCSRKDADDKTEDSGKAPAAAAVDKRAEGAAVLASDSAWMRFVTSKNVDSLMTLYASDAVSYGPGMAPAIGIDQVKASYAEFVKSAIADPKINQLGINFSDDGAMAYDHGTYSLLVTPPGGKPATMYGTYLNVFRKVDGKWKLVAEMSSPAPAPKG